jgi:hypothetical protein
MLLNQEKKSVEHAAELLKINPNYSVESVRKVNAMQKDPASYDYVIDALRKAGIPEHPA